MNHTQENPILLVRCSARGTPHWSSNLESQQHNEWQRRRRKQRRVTSEDWSLGYHRKQSGFSERPSLKPEWQLPRNKPFDTGWNLIMLLLLLTFKLAARVFFVMVYVGITVLTPSFMCVATLCKSIYQVYMHLYAKIDIILIPQEQPSFKRTYKKLTRIGKYLYKLQASHN